MRLLVNKTVFYVRAFPFKNPGGVGVSRYIYFCLFVNNFSPRGGGVLRKSPYLIALTFNIDNDSLLVSKCGISLHITLLDRSRGHGHTN